MRSHHETHGLPVFTTNRPNDYGPLHFPERLIPLVICHAIDARKIERKLGRRPAGARAAGKHA